MQVGPNLFINRSYNPIGAGAAINGGYFGSRYFAGRYFAPRYFDGTELPAVPDVDGAYFSGRYFAPRFFADRFFNGTGVAPTDALQELLAGMDVGEMMLLNDTSKKLIDAGDVYTRAYYDAGSNFANDAAVKTYTMGGYPNDDGRFLYTGIAYDKINHLAVHFGGGHSNSASNHGIAFDVIAAAESKVAAGAGGQWEQYTDPAPLSATVGGGGTRDTNWPDIVEGTDFRWPQTITGALAVLGPDPNVAPYSLHTYSAIVHDAVNDLFWVGGGSVGNMGTGGINPNGMWSVDPATRQVTLKTPGYTGGDHSGFLMAPEDGDYLFYSKGTNDHTWYAYNIGTEAVTYTSNDGGDTNTPGDGAAPMWIEDLTTAGYWDICRYTQGSGGRFMAYKKQWQTGGGLPGASQAAALIPVGVTGTYYTFEAGVTQKFGSTSGYVYVPEDRLIYAVCESDAAAHTGFLIQTIDPFQGDPTTKTQWNVDNWLAGSYTGDVPSGTFGANHEMQSGWNNKIVDLGPSYGAFLMFLNPARGDVLLVKRA